MADSTIKLTNEILMQELLSVKNSNQLLTHREIWEQLRVKDTTNKLMPVAVSLSVFFGIFGTIGTIGNVLLLMVTTRRTAKGINSTLIPVLASVDLTTCAIILPFTIIVDIWAVPVHDVTCKVLGILRAAFIFLSMFTLGLIAAERMLLICFVPNIVLSKTFLKRSVIIAFVSAVVLSFPFGLRSGVFVTYADNDTSIYKSANTTAELMEQLSEKSVNDFGACHKDDRYISDKVFQVYIIMHFVFCVLFLVYLVVCYMAIFTFVWRKQRSRYRRWNGGKIVHSENVIESSIRNTTALDPRERKSANDVMIVLEPLTPVEDDLKAEDDQMIQLSGEPSTTVVRETNNFNASVRENGRSSKSWEKAERKQPHVRIAYVLGAISFCFILSFAPYLLASTNIVFSDSNIKWKRNVRKFLVYLYFISAISNPIIYSSLGRVIKNELKNMFHFSCCSRR